MDRTRDSLKKVNRFALREYKELHPKSIKVLQVKAKSVLTRGLLPNYHVREIGHIRFLVVLDRGKEFRIYFFDKNGNNIGGQNYNITPKFLKKIEKSTVLKTQFPKKTPREFEDSTLLFQKEFSKLFHHINSVLGINHKYPYTILVRKDLQVKYDKTLGCRRVNKKIYVPSELKSKGFLEFFVSLEWFDIYISSLVEITHEDNNKLLVHDLAILLSGVYEYKNIEKRSLLNLKFVSLSGDFSRDLIVNLLKKYLGILTILKKYRIKLSPVEFRYLISQTYEKFESKNIIEEGIKFGPFFFTLFSQASMVKGQEKALIDKGLFLSALFGLTISSDFNPTLPLNTTITVITDFLKNSLIYTHVLKIENLISDILTNYIILYLDLDVYTTIQGDILDLDLYINNKSNYVLEDFSYDLLWQPKKGLTVRSREDMLKSRDLHEKKISHYTLQRGKKGSVAFSCAISFANPIFKDRKMRKKIFLKEILLGK
ncbi:MAG TPA: hypothetical protein ENI29_17145 [bacterium]|nr:hypothetical protein [bacterium]